MKKGDLTVALLLVAAAAGCAQPVHVASPTQPTTRVDEEIRTLIDLVNRHRRQVGCKDLAWSTRIAEVAQRHSDDMVRRNYFSHTSPDGWSPFQRLNAAGIRYWKAAENIAMGQATARQVFDSWIKSPGHRRNLEDCSFRQHGIGFTPGSNSRVYGALTHAWTHNFVVPRQ